jgi:hypothetical protein
LSAPEPEDLPSSEPVVAAAAAARITPVVGLALAEIAATPEPVREPALPFPVPECFDPLDPFILPRALCFLPSLPDFCSVTTPPDGEVDLPCVVLVLGADCVEGVVVPEPLPVPLPLPTPSVPGFAGVPDPDPLPLLPDPPGGGVVGVPLPLPGPCGVAPVPLPEPVPLPLPEPDPLPRPDPPPCQAPLPPLLPPPSPPPPPA